MMNDDDDDDNNNYYYYNITNMSASRFNTTQLSSLSTLYSNLHKFTVRKHL